MCGCLSHTPHWRLGPQPRHVPSPGIKPVTLWFASQHSTHWATPARAEHYFKVNTFIKTMQIKNNDKIYKISIANFRHSKMLSNSKLRKNKIIWSPNSVGRKKRKLTAFILSFSEVIYNNAKKQGVYNQAGLFSLCFNLRCNS